MIKRRGGAKKKNKRSLWDGQKKKEKGRGGREWVIQPVPKKGGGKLRVTVLSHGLKGRRGHGGGKREGRLASLEKKGNLDTKR